MIFEMLSTTLSRSITSCTLNPIKTNSSTFLKNVERNFCTTTAMRGKKRKRNSWFGKRRKNDEQRIIRPYNNCEDTAKPILEPQCKVGVVIGGADGFGFAAANHLLCKNARAVVIADDNCQRGNSAAQKLCNAHGKNRALFLQCDVRNECQFEGVLQQVLCKYKNVQILFNDLDKERPPMRCGDAKLNGSNTARTILAGVEIMSTQNDGPGGIIINCASILGFMGWPEDPTPVYCMKEPAIETTMDLSKEYTEESTGVRMVALCPINKPFSCIGLPDFPDCAQNDRPCCIPPSTQNVGTALSHVMSWAKTGSTYVVEPSISPHEIPRLIHFPSHEGEKIDPKVYESQLCPPANSHCAAPVERKCLVDLAKFCNKAKKK